MEWIRLLVSTNNLLGIEWNTWKIIGWLGNLTFFSRFLVQWYVTEKRREVVVPALFWWLSIIGASLLFAYALFYRKDSVFTFAYAFTWIPYVRNLIIHYRNKSFKPKCNSCGTINPAHAKFCTECGKAFKK